MRSMLVPTLLVIVGCSEGPTDSKGLPMNPDVGPPDPGPVDSGPLDAGAPDAAPPDTGAPDAAPPVALPCELRTLVEPTFDPIHTVFEAPFELRLSTTPGEWIRYTLDGSTPSSTEGTLYREPIQITATTVVRAIAFSLDGDCSLPRTQTYIRPEDVVTQSNEPKPGWPTEFAPSDLEGPYPADYEMDPEVVNHPSNMGRVADALRSIPSLSIVTDHANLWDPTTGVYWNSIQKGRLWERPASVEWIDPAGGAGFTANAGIRLHGQASRKPPRTPKKTMRVYFRAEYGVGKLTFPVFEDPAGGAEFDRLLLRNGGNRSWPYWDRDQRREADYVNDEWARRAQRDMGGLNARGTYAHLYLNGLYWGLYNVAELPDEKFLVAHLGGLETDYDLIKPDEEIGNLPAPEIGTVDAYNEIISMLEVASVTNELYAEVEARVDLLDLLDFIILNHYIGKTDWPNHNWLAYRKRIGDDTRFKFIAWDNDSGLNKLVENTTLREFPGSPVMIFNRLLDHPTFRQLLSERLQLHIAPGGALSPARCAERYAALTSKIDMAVIAESARWGDYSRDVYTWMFADPPKSAPAYLYSRDLPHAYTDPQDLVTDEFQKTWVQVRDEKLQFYCPERATMLVEQYRANHWLE